VFPEIQLILLRGIGVRKFSPMGEMWVMKQITVLLVFVIGLALSSAAQSSPGIHGGDHFEAGVFADYFNLSRTSPNINYVGFGGRLGFNVRPSVQIEAELGYDFGRAFTSEFNNGGSLSLVQTKTRTLHGFFGPKFQFGSGPLRPFVTFKTGFTNFSVTEQNAASGFFGSLGNVTGGGTSAAILPGAGVEGFLGPIGLRLDVGDEIYFDNGARHNLRVTFGPHIRF
jgi:hypothetical protein